ncbi:MAG TPA: hypothetical protein VN851_01700 [Thermoanaerobaculia bacterium]|nr:hypothetical protein [Thermoanaerobaculia bacterium]
MPNDSQEITDADAMSTVESPAPVNVRPVSDTWPPPNLADPDEPDPTQKETGAAS